MYLARLKQTDARTIDDRLALASRIAAARRKYGNPANEQAMHRMICDMAGGTKRSRQNLLYMRVDNALIVQSDEPLDRHAVETLGYKIDRCIDLDEATASLQKGSIVALTGKYAPTKLKQSIADPDDRKAWVMRKMSECGMTVDVRTLKELRQDHITFRHKNDDQNRFVNGITYALVARVDDPERLRQALRSGIGRGKAYGCGMTLLRQLR